MTQGLATIVMVRRRQRIVVQSGLPAATARRLALELERYCIDHRCYFIVVSAATIAPPDRAEVE